MSETDNQIDESFESIVLHTTVDIPFIVGLAREHLLTKQWRKAIPLLQDALVPKLGLDTVVAILKGELTLVNKNDGVEVVPQNIEDPTFKRFKSNLEWQTAGTLEKDGFFYRPYLRFISFNPESNKNTIETIKSWQDCVPLKDYLKLRALEYAHNKYSDIVAYDSTGLPVLFEKVPDLPFWIETHKAAEDAVTAFQKVRKLETENHSNKSKDNPLSWQFYAQAIVEGVAYVSDFEAVHAMDASNKNKLNKLADMRDALDELHADQTRYFNEEYEIDKLRDAVDLLIYEQDIVEQATKNGGFLDLKVKEHNESETVIKVPRLPFLHWAARRSTGDKILKGMLQPWTPICPSGLKMLGDDPNHTDWWVGAGLGNPKAAYALDNPVDQAAWRYAFALATAQKQSAIKLAGKGKVIGVVVHPKPNEEVPAGAIAIVPRASPEYEIVLMSACKKEGRGAVISEAGGKLAHLAIVSREFGARLAVAEKALENFKPGDLLSIDFDTMEITKLEQEDYTDD